MKTPQELLLPIQRLTDKQLEDVIALADNLGFNAMCTVLFRERYNDLKEEAFRALAVNDVDKIMHGNRHGQKTMMDFVAHLPVEAKRELENRKKQQAIKIKP